MTGMMVLCIAGDGVPEPANAGNAPGSPSVADNTLCSVTFTLRKCMFPSRESLRRAQKGGRNCLFSATTIAGTKDSTPVLTMVSVATAVGAVGLHWMPSRLLTMGTKSNLPANAGFAARTSRHDRPLRVMVIASDVEPAS